MRGVLNADDFADRLRRIRADYEGIYQLSIKKIRQQFANNLTGKVPPDVDSLLEAHLRQYFINGFLKALNWRFGVSPDEGLPNLIPEAPIQSTFEGTTRFLDYLGMDGVLGKALLIVETKRPSSSLPVPRNNEIIEEESIANLISKALAGKSKVRGVTQDWQEWLQTLRDYVQSVKDQSQEAPKRVVLTNGEWLILFADPEDAFLSTNPTSAKIRVYKDCNRIEECAAEICGLLEYQKVVGRTPALEVGQVAFHIQPTLVDTAMYGLRLLYIEKPDFWNPLPIITVLPVVFIRSKVGVWFRIENRTDGINLPHKSEQIPEHLKSVQEQAFQLLNDINHKLNINLIPDSLTNHYSSEERFNELKAIFKLPGILGKYEEYLIVTGDNTHYLKEEPTVTNCPYHSWQNSFQEKCSTTSVVRPTINNPRTLFVSGTLHHCSHKDIFSAKSSQITPNNRERCGNRSGEDYEAFCEIWRFEEHLCCRVCVFEKVCTKAEVFTQLPCKSID